MYRMKSMDIKTICRLCLESNKQTNDIYSTYYAKKKLLYSDMISNCTKLKPVEKDGLPRLICNDCSRQLKRTYEFKEQCENSERTLKSLLHTSISDNFFVVSDNPIKEEIVDFQDEKDDFQDNKEFQEDGHIQEDDDAWDAEDDNVFLKKIKQDKTALTESLSNVNTAESQDLDIKTDNKSESITTEIVSDNVLEKEKPKKGSRRLHQCDECGKCVSTKSNLKAHKICHTDLRPFKCDECPATFRGHSALSQHRKVHSPAQPYHCEYCSKAFRRRSGLVNHIRTHTGDRQYSCTICSKKFVQKTQLATHLRRHKGAKDFLCQDCGKGFPVKSDLVVHQRIHSGDKPYSCNMCEKAFTTSGNLRIHVRMHNQERKFKCPECSRSFVTTSSYNVHMKRHRGQRDHRCECGKAFYTTSALKQHSVVHSGLRRYQCRVCERRFGQHGHLTRHFRRDHAPPDRPLPPPASFRRVLPAEPHPALPAELRPAPVKSESLQ